MRIAIVVPTAIVAAGAFVLMSACASSHRVPPTALNDDERRDTAARVVAAQAIVESLSTDPDNAIPRGIAESAACLCVVPSMVHAGLIVGFRRGRGVVTCRNEQGWSTPAFVRVSGSGAGLLIGVASVDLVMLFMSPDASRTLSRARVELGASSSLTAGPVGREVQATTQAGTGESVVCYSHSQGLFAGLELTDVVLEPDDEAARPYYGDGRDFGVLLRGTPEAPPEVAPFLKSVGRAFGSAL